MKLKIILTRITGRGQLRKYWEKIQYLRNLMNKQRLNIRINDENKISCENMFLFVW